MDKISVIIPVHNGEKFLKKTIKGILKQDYKNIEILLVENFSNDKSLEVCKALSMQDSRVRVISSKERGTSMARKKGIEEASGKYILFVDQDDGFLSKDSVRKMYDAIVEDGVQVVQFGYYKGFMFGIRKKKLKTQKKLTLTQEEMIKKEIAGVLGGDSNFTTTVWSKIYDAALLKSVALEINEELYFAEDMNLCIKTFLNERMLKTSFRPEAYYVWKQGVGFSSSSRSALALLRDYQCVKLSAIKYAERYKIPDEIMYQVHLETLGLLKFTINNLILENASRDFVEEIIASYSNCDFIQQAKKFVSSYKKNKMWEGLRFMVGEYTPSEYYDFCLSNLSYPTLKQKILKVIRRLYGLGNV